MKRSPLIVVLSRRFDYESVKIHCQSTVVPSNLIVNQPKSVVSRPLSRRFDCESAKIRCQSAVVPSNLLPIGENLHYVSWPYYLLRGFSFLYMHIFSLVKCTSAFGLCLSILGLPPKEWVETIKRRRKTMSDPPSPPTSPEAEPPSNSPSPHSLGWYYIIETLADSKAGLPLLKGFPDWQYIYMFYLLFILVGFSILNFFYSTWILFQSRSIEFPISTWRLLNRYGRELHWDIWRNWRVEVW